MTSNNIINIVTFSGGSGHFVLLRALRDLPGIAISAVVTMTDNGKSTGVLRRELGILPPGDIRRCLGALATQDPELAESLELRFSQGFLSGHTFGNIFIAALTEKLGGFDAAITYLHGLLGVRGHVIPCTLDQAQLHAELGDGTVLVGEEKIDVTLDVNRSPIQRVWVEPAATAHPAALAAIGEADYLIFGPGDFYTSVIPTVLMTGMPEAIRAAQGQTVLVCNRTQKVGETSGLTAVNLVEELEHYTGAKIDILIANNNNAHTQPLPPIAIDEAALSQRGLRVVLADLADQFDGLRLDGKKVANTLQTLWKK